MLAVIRRFFRAPPSAGHGTMDASTLRISHKLRGAASRYNRQGFTRCEKGTAVLIGGETMRFDHFARNLGYAAVLLAVQAGTACAASPASQPQPTSLAAPNSAAPNVVVAPYAGHVNHAHRVPTFRWGWFGAEHHHPRVHWHQGYNGDLVRWAEQRRY